MQAIPIPGHPDIVTVVFHWSTKHGQCYDCGLPAGYTLSSASRPDLGVMRLCSVCAAYNIAAGNGDTLIHLFPDEPGD